MAYIETHQSLLTHRKTLRLGRLLGMDRFAVTGRLMALWCWALDNAPDGTIGASDGDILADVMGWDGTPSALCEALVSAGFLDASEGVYVIHDWYDYAGRLIEKRKSDAERKRVARSSVSRPADVQRMSGGRRADGAGTVPNRTVTDPTISLDSEDGSKTFATEAAASDDASGTGAMPLTASEPQKPHASKAAVAAAATPPSAPQRSAAPPRSQPVPHQRNPLWDELVKQFAYEPASKAERSKWGKVVADLKTLDATPDEIRVRCQKHRDAGLHWTLTPNALVSHWGELGQLPIEALNGHAALVTAGAGAAVNGRVKPSPAPAPDARQFSPWGPSP